jgi:hypothetical protein
MHRATSYHFIVVVGVGVVVFLNNLLQSVTTFPGLLPTDVFSILR